MQDEHRRAAGAAQKGYGLVCLSRDGVGDPRWVWVPEGAARTPHMAVETGGRRRWLEVAALAVYVDSDWYPEEWRSGGHGRGSMPLIVIREATDPAVYARLLAEGEKVWHTREFVERRRARLARRRALARGEE